MGCHNYRSWSKIRIQWLSTKATWKRWKKNSQSPRIPNNPQDQLGSSHPRKSRLTATSSSIERSTAPPEALTITALAPSKQNHPTPTKSSIKLGYALMLWMKIRRDWSSASGNSSWVYKIRSIRVRTITIFCLRIWRRFGQTWTSQRRTSGNCWATSPPRESDPLQL